MAVPLVDEESLIAYDNAAAGHEGVLSDATGELVIKPCTPAEVAFYEETVRDHPDFAPLMPTFMGTLALGKTRHFEETLNSAQVSAGSALVLSGSEQVVHPAGAVGGTAEEPPLPSRGKRLDTGLAVVLENIAAGFKRPNILDVKLGKRLWADDAPPAKRTKFDDLSAKTTSGTLGFRIAGMKVWKGHDYATYDKLYGRSRTEESVVESFEELLCVKDESFQAVKQGVVEAVAEIERAIQSQEGRMYSSSLLFVYEGDEEARRQAIAAAEEAMDNQEPGAELEEDDDDELSEAAATQQKLFDVRIIDFAHAQWTPGNGPDENMLCGISSIRRILQKIAWPGAES